MRRHAPLLAGILVGWLLLWWWGSAWVLDERLGGYRWPDYLRNAWMVFSDQPEAIHRFRKPLHALMLAPLGEALGSFPNGAIALSSACMTLAVVGVALGARSLAGSWAGGVAAASVPWVANNAEAARWANSYTLLAACSLLGICLALGSTRGQDLRVKALLALGAGLFAGLGWATDERGLAMVPVALAFVLLGLRSRWGLLRVLLFAAGLAVGPAINATQPKNPYALGWEEKMETQAQVVHRWIILSGSAPLIQACEGADLRPSLRAIATECGQAQLEHNTRKTLPRHLPFGLLTLLGLPLCLLPGRGGARASLAGGVLVATCVGSWAFMGSMTLIPERYALQLVLPWVLVVPVGLARLAQHLPRRGLAPLLLLPAAAWAVGTDASDRYLRTAVGLDTNYHLLLGAADRLRRELPSDATLLDCSQWYVDLALLPRELHDRSWPTSGDNTPTIEHALACERWIQEGGDLMAVDGSSTWFHRASRTRKPPSVLVREAGWERWLVEGDFEVWQRP